jgi:hypothetical protein
LKLDQKALLEFVKASSENWVETPSFSKAEDGFTEAIKQQSNQLNAGLTEPY